MPFDARLAGMQAPHLGHWHEDAEGARPGRGDLPALRRPHNQTFPEAIGNPRREAHDTRRQAEYAAREREYKEHLRRIAAQEKAEREARRPVCADCGTRFTDERWKAIEPDGWGAPRTRPHLCDDCKQRAITAERQAEQAGHEPQQSQAVPEQRATSWLSRFRT
ncbi:hypothetical protein [Streptomyces olivaceoviridis]|uniref:hypothetical protein n=1 Tax=Streptomyces olivaceoviridis TaxID=1921 RepID=UPI003696CB45